MLEVAEEEKQQEGSQIMELLSVMMGKITKGTETKRTITKSFADEFSAMMLKINEIVVKELKEKELLRGRLMERKEIIELIKKEEIEVRRQQASSSYAEAVVKRKETVPQISGLGQVRAAPKVVFIRSKEKESDEVKKKLKEIIRPKDHEINVRRLTKIRNGLRIEVEDEKSVEKLLTNDTIREAGMEAEKPRKKKPVVMIYDVWKDVEEGKDKEKSKEERREETMEEWQKRWSETEKGRETYKYMPDVRERKKQDFRVSHYVTQYLSGHGNFNAKLKQFNLVERGDCPICEEEETSWHVLKRCKIYEEERKPLEEILTSKAMEFERENLLRDEEVRKVFWEVVKKIGKKKEGT
ncbi:hypothetical protein M0802_014068 [Mischocyttarus mexicanus]|nr:hypothetical protein M0802_014068 [Mischocyttarus mexicanus]